MVRPTVTVVIPVYNEAAHIAACLRSVLDQTYDRVDEILVIDGGSTDATVELVTGFDGVGVLDNPRRSQAAGLNIGIAAARSEVIVRVDGHSVLDRDHIEQSVGALVATGAAMVGAVMRPRGTTAFGRSVELAMATKLGVGPARFHHGGSGWVDTAYLGTFWTDRARAIDGYDESLVPNEDAEFAHRLQECGGVWLEDSIEVLYVPRDSWASLSRQYFKYGVARANTVRKHPRSLKPRQLAAPMLVIGLCIGPRRAVLGAYGAVVVGRTGLSYANHGKDALLMAVAMPTMHLCWGVGFIAGLVGLKP
jgi:glycosyltransferase involved in cell wall biosynthesis